MTASSDAPVATAPVLRPDGGVVVGGSFDLVDGTLREHLVGLRGSPSADCPLIGVLAKVPTTRVPGVMSSVTAGQVGAFQIKASQPSSIVLTVHYRLSGKGTSLVTSELSNSTSVVLRVLRQPQTSTQ